MRAPKDMEIIQIEVTNACPHLCANCTRFCGHHPKPFFMDLGAFRQAVDSLDGFPGTVGVMGGEPTLHPKFEQLAGYIRQKRLHGGSIPDGREPIADFGNYALSRLGGEKRGYPGLWTSLGPGYYRNFESIQETFRFQLINDHVNPGLHQALLVTRKEMGIPDDEWIRLRDKCWIQNLWSAAITPKGAFFCEVAAALDMLYDGPGGWPVEPGWWKRGPEDFGDQLQWCEKCSAALDTPRCQANLKRDIVSPLHMEHLLKIGSPKFKKGLVRTWAPEPRTSEDSLNPSNVWFLPDANDRHRVTGTCDSIKPKRLDAILIDDGTCIQAEARSKALEMFDRVVFLVEETSRLPRDADPASPAEIIRMAKDAHLEGINAALVRLAPKDWFMIMPLQLGADPSFRDRIMGSVINPGCLYTAPHDSTTPAAAPSVFLANARARAFKRRGDLAMLAVHSASWKTAILSLWPADKRIATPLLVATGSVPMPAARCEIQNNTRDEASGRLVRSIVNTIAHTGRRYALFGAGKHTTWLLEVLSTNALPLPNAVYDDAPSCESIAGVPVLHPRPGSPPDADLIILSTDTHQQAMRRRCMELWGDVFPVISFYDL